MVNKAEENVSSFYNQVGWKSEGQITEDAKRYEDLRENAKEYVSKCRLRVLRHIPNGGENILDMASGPIQYKEYLEYSKSYKKRYCVDLSSKALDDAKSKIGEHGVFLCGSFFDIDLDRNFFDCTISLHTIYHMDKEKQEEAVRKLIAVTKPGKPIVIVYRNPNTLLENLILPLRTVKRTLTGLKNKLAGKKSEVDLYAFAHPVSWWNKFSDLADIEMFPWRSFYSPHQKILVPDNKLGKKVFDVLFKMEEKFPNFFINNFQYYTVVLHKKESLESDKVSLN